MSKLINQIIKKSPKLKKFYIKKNLFLNLLQNIMVDSTRNKYFYEWWSNVFINEVSLIFWWKLAVKLFGRKLIVLF